MSYIVTLMFLCCLIKFCILYCYDFTMTLANCIFSAQKELVQKRIEELFEVYRNKSEEIRIEVLKVVAALSSDVIFIS